MKRSDSSLVLLIGISILVPANVKAATQPCWCSGVRRFLNHTSVSLAAKYGAASLDKANVILGSEKDAASPELSRRLEACMRDPLRRFNIGVIGGSMAVPKLDGGCWACNVTRWLNALLSHSQCRSQQDLVAGGSESTVLLLPCSLPLSRTKEAHAVYQGCSHKRSAFAESPVTFCSPASVFWDPSWGTDVTSEQQQHEEQHHLQQLQEQQQLEGGEVLVGGKRRSSSSRPPSSSLCDESPPKRPCTVHWGSGQHARVSSGAIGASTTSEAVWMHQRALNQEAGDDGLTLDMVFWDYSTNDMARGGGTDPPLSFAALLAQLKRSHPTLAAFLAVFWFDRVGKKTNGKERQLLFACHCACHFAAPPSPFI
jgi:hypothetical protein